MLQVFHQLIKFSKMGVCGLDPKFSELTPFKRWKTPISNKPCTCFRIDLFAEKEKEIPQGDFIDF